MIYYPEEIKKVLNETYNQQFSKKKKAIKLPCSDLHKYREPVYIEVTNTGDQTILCPKCGRKHYLTWSKLQDNLKWT